MRISFGGIFFSLLFAIITASGAVLVAQEIFSQPPSYPDFIVGAIAWNAHSKFQDLASYPAFLLFFFAGGWLSLCLFQRVSLVRLQEQSLNTALLWWMVPVAIGTGGFLSIYPNSSSFVFL